LSRGRGSYKARGIYRQLAGPVKLGGYRSRLGYSATPGYRSWSYKPESHKPNRQVVEKTSYPSASREPIYRTKERLVYDPEVKHLLEKIERNLRAEPREEDVLKLLEEDPELYEKISERLNGKLEPEEGVEEKASEENRNEPLEDLKIEAANNDDAETKVEAEPLEERAQDESLENAEPLESLVEPNYASELDAAEDMEAQNFSSIESELYQESSESKMEPTETLEQIEAQDLSMLEAELYTEPLESTEESEPENDEYG